MPRALTAPADVLLHDGAWTSSRHVGSLAGMQVRSQECVWAPPGDPLTTLQDPPGPSGLEGKPQRDHCDAVGAARPTMLPTAEARTESLVGTAISCSR